MNGRSDEEELLVQKLDRTENVQELGRVVDELVSIHAGTTTRGLERTTGGQLSHAEIIRMRRGELLLPKDKFMALVQACGIRDLEPWENTHQRISLGQIIGDNHGVVISGSGGITVNQWVGHGGLTVGPNRHPTEPDLSNERQRFHFEFLQLAMRQAEATFRLSVLFMSGGAMIILAGGVLALINAGNPGWSYLPILTSLSGLLITTCGGAFALHSNRARKHLTEQADRIHKNIESDQAFSQAQSLIEQIEDLQLRDRLKSFTALHILGITPEPREITERLLSPPAGPSEESQ